ncbi:MAG: SpaA isopeptide-forming pilin-related protein [Thermomicrobiales bacterium]
MIDFVRETGRLAGLAIEPWRRLDHWLRAVIAALPAWGLALAVAFGAFPFWSLSGGEASAALPPVVAPPVPGAMATMRYEDGGVVLYARGVDGSWEEIKPLDDGEAPGQFAKFATTSPDRRLVSYVKADDQLMSNARISVVDIATGQERDLATIPTGFFPVTPVWSPDASRLAFAQKSGEHVELWVIHIATGELVPVPTEEPISPRAFYGSNPSPLVWAEDGESLSFDMPDQSGRRMVHYNVDVDSGKQKKREGNELPEEEPCDLPVFSQNDPRWADTVMRELGDTIGAAGCALTSTAMVLNFYGSSSDPGTLSACLGPAAEPIFWAVAAQRNCNDGTGQFEDYVAFTWDKLASMMAEGRPVVLGFAGGISGSHYVVVKSGFGSDGANYSIIDPWDGTTWKTIEYYAEKGYSPEWLVIYRGEEGECTARTTAPPVKAPDLSFGTEAAGVEGTWQWRPLIEQVAGETGVDPDIMQAIMALESGGDPNTIGPYTGSLGEAMGLMQVMNGLDGPWNFVAQYTGSYPTHDEMLVPINNIRAGAYELKWRHDLGGNWSDWFISAVGYFGATTPDGQITGARDAFGTDGWAYYDRIRANYIAIRQRLGGGGDIPPPPNDVRRPAEWPPAGTIEMLLGGAPYSISQGFGYTGFTPGPGAYDYSSAYGLQAGDHAAIDIAIPYGTPLFSPITTSVQYASADIYFAPNHVDLNIPGMGGCAEVIFGHMSEMRVSAGQAVEPGTFLGYSGTAGTGPHLHLEVRVPDASTSSGCRAVDPRIFFGMGGDYTQLPRPEGGPAPPPPPGPSEPTPTGPAAPPAPPAPALPTNTPRPTNTPTLSPTSTATITATATGTIFPTATSGDGTRRRPTETPTTFGVDGGTPIATETPGGLTRGQALPTATASSDGTPPTEQGPTLIRGGVQDQVPPPGLPGSGRLPGTPTPVPPRPPVQAQELPIVTIIGPQDWESYNAPIRFERYIVDFPADPKAVVSVKPQIGTTFKQEGKHEIAVTVISPKIPGGLMIHTVAFFIDYSMPVINAEIAGKQYRVPLDADQGLRGMVEPDAGAPRALAAPAVQPGETIAPTSCYDGEATISFTYDDSGTPIKAAAYRVDGGKWRYYTNNAIPHPISIRRHGSHSLEYYAVDAAGNQSLSSVVSLCVVANPAVPIQGPEPTATVTPSPTPEERIDEERDPDLRILEPDQLPGTPTDVPPTTTRIATPAPASPTAEPPTTTATSTPTQTPELSATSTQTPESGATATSTPVPPPTAPPPIVQTPTNTPTRMPTESPEPTEEGEGERLFPTATATIEPTVSVSPTAGPTTGSIEVLKLDDEDQSLAGACFAIEADGPQPTVTTGDGGLPAACDEDDGANDGRTVITDLAAGEYDLIETSSPPGYAPIAPIRITVEAGQTLTYEVVNSTRLGGIIVVWEGGQSAPSPAACFELFTFGGPGGAGEQVRDEQCIDESVATFTYADLIPGNYVIAQTVTPVDHQTAQPLFVPVLSGSTTEITVRNELLPGSLTIETLDEATNERIFGACFDVYTNDSGVRGTRVTGACDDGDGAADGLTTIGDIPPGSFFVVETRTPPNYAAAPDREISVVPDGEETIVVTNTLIPGAVTIQKTNAATGEPLAGACFTIYADDDVDYVDPIQTVCDSGDGADDGSSAMTDVAPGDYVLVETVFPPGFNPAEDTPFEVVAGAPTNLVVPNEPIFGGLRISKLGEDTSEQLPGACFDIHQDDGSGGPGALVASVCDSADGTEDGLAEVTGLAPGGYVIVETTVPAGYLAAPNTLATVTANTVAEVTIVDPVQRATLTVRKVDPDGVLLNGACFDLYTSAGGSPDEFMAGGCDGDQIQTAGGGVFPDSLDGAMTFGDLPAGAYVVIETLPPPGYGGALPTEVTLDAGENAVIDVVNSFDPVGDAQIAVYTDPGDGRVPLPGACIAIYEFDTYGTSTPPIVQQCDEDSNGVLLFTSIPVEHYVAFVSDTPEGFQSGGSVPFEITMGQTAQVEIDVDPVPHYAVTVRTLDFYSSELAPGACYRVRDASDATLRTGCDGDDGANDGETAIAPLPIGGPYYLEQTTTPNGYFEPSVREFSVSDNLTLDVIIEPTSTPTPLPTGSIRILIRGLGDVPLEGACFHIHNDLGGSTVTPFNVTICDASSGSNADGDPDGIVLVGSLDPGPYRVEVTSFPPGYEDPDGISLDVDVTAGSTLDVPINLAPATGSITVTLRERWTSAPLPDREFQLFHNDTETIVATGQTNSEGILVFSDVTPDTGRPDAYCVLPMPVSGWSYTPENQCAAVGAGENIGVEFTSEEPTS